jgi:hypothetical protein
MILRHTLISLDTNHYCDSAIEFNEVTSQPSYHLNSL